MVKNKNFRGTMNLFFYNPKLYITHLSMFFVSLMTTNIFRQAEVGGPVMSFAGNFIGLNYYHHKENPFIPSLIVLKCLRQLKLFRYAHFTLHKGKANRFVGI
jgi:hypothetical protein